MKVWSISMWSSFRTIQILFGIISSQIIRIHHIVKMFGSQLARHIWYSDHATFKSPLSCLLFYETYHINKRQLPIPKIFKNKYFQLFSNVFHLRLQCESESPARNVVRVHHAFNANVALQRFAESAWKTVIMRLFRLDGRPHCEIGAGRCDANVRTNAETNEQ